MRQFAFFNLKEKGVKMILLNMLAVIIFAVLYYTQDYIISYYPKFANKYMLSKIKEKNQSDELLYTLKPATYYLWFSLITQTTVGYTGMLESSGNSGTFTSMRSNVFKFLNILQLISIFLIPFITFER